MPDRNVLSDREASALGSLHEDKAEIRRLRAEVERLHKAWQLQQNLLVQDAKDCEALRAENEHYASTLARVAAERDNARNDVETLRECLEAAGAKFHELDLPVYADACLRESRGAVDETLAPEEGNHD